MLQIVWLRSGLWFVDLKLFHSSSCCMLRVCFPAGSQTSVAVSSILQSLIGFLGFQVFDPNNLPINNAKLPCSDWRKQSLQLPPLLFSIGMISLVLVKSQRFACRSESSIQMSCIRLLKNCVEGFLIAFFQQWLSSCWSSINYRSVIWEVHSE